MNAFCYWILVTPGGKNEGKQHTLLRQLAHPSSASAAQSQNGILEEQEQDCREPEHLSG